MNNKISPVFFMALALMFVTTMRAQDNETKPSLVVFVVGMDNQVGDFLAILIGNELSSGDRYEVITHTDVVQKKLRELRKYEQNGSELIEWGRQNNVSTLCLVIAIKLDEHMFAAQLIDVKSNRFVGSGDYSTAKLGSADLKQTAESLASQLHSYSGFTKGNDTLNSKQNTQLHPAEPEMIFVQGGTFWMGCSDEQSSCDNDEDPLHSVTVSSFSIGKYEVTQAQWTLIMGNNPSNFKGDSLPVEMVSQNDAQEFISRLNAATNKQYRLPTEAEWEYAARGGDKSQNYKYSGSNNMYNAGWFKSNSESTHQAGRKLPNELEIYDMSGNVWEWCSDWYGAYPDSEQQDPTGASSGSDSVIRGGSWSDGANRCRVASRSSSRPASRYRDLGFRLVLP